MGCRFQEKHAVIQILRAHAMSRPRHDERRLLKIFETRRTGSPFFRSGPIIKAQIQVETFPGQRCDPFLPECFNVESRFGGGFDSKNFERGLEKSLRIKVQFRPLDHQSLRAIERIVLNREFAITDSPVAAEVPEDAGQKSFSLLG